MLIVLFAVCAVFGIVCIALWAGLSSARLRLSHTEAVLAKLLVVLERDEAITPAERQELKAQVEALRG